MRCRFKAQTSSLMRTQLSSSTSMKRALPEMTSMQHSTSSPLLATVAISAASNLRMMVSKPLFKTQTIFPNKVSLTKMWNCCLSKELRHQLHQYSHQNKPKCTHRHLLLRKSLKSLKSQSPLRKVAESLRSRSSRSKPLLKIQRRHSRNKMGSATLNPNATPEPKNHLNSFVRRVDSHSMPPKNLGVTCLKHTLGPVPATLRR